MKVVKFYMEEKDNHKKSLESLNSRYISEFCEKFGGSTVYKANGLWIDGGKLFDENVVICEVFAKGSRWALSRYFKKAARRYAKDADQLAVSVVIDGKAYIYYNE